VLFTTYRYDSASELLLGGSIFPAVQNFLLAARAQGLGACLTSWASYGGEQLRWDQASADDVPGRERAGRRAATADPSCPPEAVSDRRRCPCRPTGQETAP